MKIFLTVWKEQAKKTAEEFGLRMVGNKVTVVSKVTCEKMSAEGRHKIGITIDMEKNNQSMNETEYCEYCHVALKQGTKYLYCPKCGRNYTI